MVMGRRWSFYRSLRAPEGDGSNTWWVRVIKACCYRQDAIDVSTRRRGSSSATSITNDAIVSGEIFGELCMISFLDLVITLLIAGSAGISLCNQNPVLGYRLMSRIILFF